MASALHRVTKAFLVSANTPDYPLDAWIINPDLSAVAGLPQKYWKISGDVVSAMSQIEKDAVDAQHLSDSLNREMADVDAGIIRRLAVVMLGEINTLRTAAGLPTRTLAQLKNAMRNA